MENETIEINGKRYAWDSVVHLMDDDVREAVHGEMAPCTNQMFFTVYCKRHADQFGPEDFADCVRQMGYLAE